MDAVNEIGDRDAEAAADDETVLDNPERLQTELHQPVLAIAATNKSNTLNMKKQNHRKNENKNKQKNKTQDQEKNKQNKNEMQDWNQENKRNRNQK